MTFLAWLKVAAKGSAAYKDLLKDYMFMCYRYKTEGKPRPRLNEEHLLSHGACDAALECYRNAQNDYANFKRTLI